MKRDLGLFLQDILESISKIESFSKGLTKENFSKDELRQSAIMRKLEIIGEAVKNLPISFRNKYPFVDWRSIAGFRDILTHGYFGVNIEKVWNVIKYDMPKLKKNIEKILKDYNK
jgi:uncharacterized protein with HEPN domain